MDRFSYNYLTINGERSNRLDYVNDTGTDYASYDDIKTGQSTGNYKYNRIGELTEDVQENMILEWRYGDHKLQKIERTDADSPEVEFFYNPLGVRVGKLVKPRQNGDIEPQNSWTYYYYAYDANGQLMAVYDSKLYSTNGETILEEQYIYGSDRIGSIQKGLLVFDNNAIAPSNDPYVENTLGQKRYELKNHLGTVNVTISDRKTYNSLEDAFEATVTNYAETYAFGMLMPNRNHNASESRYLYHGMEQDVEVSGSGNSYTTEFRQYDPRLGRWKSLDPLMKMFPSMSPYAAYANNPIVYTDPYGLAPVNGDGNGDDGGPEFEESIPSKKGGVNGEEWEEGDTYVRQDKEGNYWTSTLTIDKNGDKVWRTKMDNVATAEEYTVTAEVKKPKTISRSEWGAMPTNGSDYTPVENPNEFYDHIAIHHAGNDNSPTINEVQEDHIEGEGWHDIGYHFAVDLEGNIYEGRSINKRGAGAGAADREAGIIHIIILGDFQSKGAFEWSNDDLSDEAVESLLKLTRYLVIEYGIRFIGGHQSVYCNHTVCPGNQVMDRMEEIIEESGGSPADCLITE